MLVTDLFTSNLHDLPIVGEKSVSVVLRAMEYYNKLISYVFLKGWVHVHPVQPPNPPLHVYMSIAKSICNFVYIHASTYAGSNQGMA